MYRCNNCNATFEQYDTIKESSGEKQYVCPYCKETDFDEVQQRGSDDKFLMITKATVIDYVVSAIACINKNDVGTAKEDLVELICEMVDDSFFEYKSRLDSVTDDADKLIADLQELVEVVRV